MMLYDNERSLFQLVAEGDEQAFNRLFHLFLPRLYPFIIKLTRSEAVTQDIIQETFIKVWLYRDRLGEIENPGGWLYTLAANKCYDHLRSQASRNALFVPITGDATVGNTTYTWLDSRELKRLIELAVNELPSQRKKVYQMSRNQGMTIPEIAAALDLSPHTVKHTLVSSLKSIREYLSGHGIRF